MISGYSSFVEMRLRLPGGAFLGVAQSGPGYLILDQPTDLAPTSAVLEFAVDGKVTEHPIHLPQGIRGIRATAEQSATIAAAG